jgi:uncharacterized protein (TIGR02145 family)
VAFGCQEEIGVIGCTDELAYNFNADAEVDNGNCQYIEGCTDPAALNYNEYAMIMDGSCLYEGEGGGETNENPNGPCEGQNVLTYDGYDYPLIAVGSQCWMQENLQAMNNNAGTPFSTATIGGDDGFVTGEIAYFENDFSAVDSRGILYQRQDSIFNKACPVGWRPSNFGDIETMSSETNVEINALGHRLKASAPLWNGVDQFGLTFLINRGANTSGFYTSDLTGGTAMPNTNSTGYELYSTNTSVNTINGGQLNNRWNPIRCIKE